MQARWQRWISPHYLLDAFRMRFWLLRFAASEFRPRKRMLWPFDATGLTLPWPV